MCVGGLRGFKEGIRDWYCMGLRLRTLALSSSATMHLPTSAVITPSILSITVLSKPTTLSSNIITSFPTLSAPSINLLQSHLTSHCLLSFLVIPASPTGTPHTTQRKCTHACKLACWPVLIQNQHLIASCIVWTQCMFDSKVFLHHPQATSTPQPPPTNPGPPSVSLPFNLPILSTHTFCLPCPFLCLFTNCTYTFPCIPVANHTPRYLKAFISSPLILQISPPLVAPTAIVLLLLATPPHTATSDQTSSAVLLGTLLVVYVRSMPGTRIVRCPEESGEWS